MKSLLAHIETYLALFLLDPFAAYENDDNQITSLLEILVFRAFDRVTNTT